MRPKEEKKNNGCLNIFLFLLLSLAIIAITINCVAYAWISYVLI
jgi:hypothetical protein